MKSSRKKSNNLRKNPFLVCDMRCVDNFSPYALKVYTQLRKLTSFEEECDTVIIAVKSLALRAGISERKTYSVLNELEHTHFVIHRSNYNDFRYGKTNCFYVSETYNYFKPPIENTEEESYINHGDNPVQFLTTPARNAVPTARKAYLKKQESSQEVYQEKQNKEPSVSVFSDDCSIKDHIEKTVANRNQLIEDETVAQIIFYIGHLRTYDHVIKKVNIALKLVREGKWNIPQGFNGISSQSIRHKEEEEHKAKLVQYAENAQAYKAILQTISQGEGRKHFSALAKKLKGEARGQQGAMSKTAIQSGHQVGS